MTRLIKILSVAGFSSVYLMQTTCAFAEHGFSIVPNGILPNPFASIAAALGL